MSQPKPRPYIPTDLRRQIFTALHSMSHPGTRPTTKLVTDRFVWPSVRKDCRTWVKSCEPCQRSKVQRHTSSPVADFPLTTHRFSHVHIDLIGPLPPSTDFRYCLTAVDRFTRWPEVKPLTDISAETVARAFYEIWISRFGCPETVTTDQGRQFNSHLFKSLTDLCGIRLRHTTAYHPQANGMVERFHRTLKAAIMAHGSTRWTDVLPIVLLGVRTAWKEDIHCSAAEMVYGETLRIPGEFFHFNNSQLPQSADFVSQLKNYMSRLQPVPVSRHSQKSVFIHEDLKTAKYIFLRKDALRGSLEAPYTGPHRVIKRTDKTVTVELPRGPVTVSVDRTKPAYILTDMEYSTSNSPTPSEITTKPIRTTRSGRTVNFPDYFSPGR